MESDKLEENTDSGPEAVSAPSANLALTLVALSWCAWTVFQTVELVIERNHLSQLRVGQETPFQEASKVRAQIESITADTVKLAAGGNANAQRIVAELRKRGFKIGADAKVAKPVAK